MLHGHIDNNLYYLIFFNKATLCLTSVCLCIVSIIVNDDQKYATILAYLFIPNQRYMFRAMSSPIIRST